MVQRNESDIVAAPITLPVADETSLRQDQVMMEDKMYIASGYNLSSERTYGDILDTFSEFSSELWTLVILTLFSLNTLYKIHMYTHKHYGKLRTRLRLQRREHGYIFWSSLRYLLKQPDIKYINDVTRYLLSLSIIFFFFFMNFFENSFKTDLVSVSPPVLISTYSDILSRPDIRPIWSETYGNDLEQFKYADEGTEAKLIYERGKEFGLDKCLASFRKAEEWPDIMRDIMSQKAVGLSNIVFTLFGRNIYCSMAYISNVTTFSRVTVDPSDVRILKGYVMRRSSQHPKIGLIQKRACSLFEAGFLNPRLLDVGRDLFPIPYDRQDCLSDKISAEDDQGSERMGLKSMYKLLIVCLIGLFIAITVLLLENYYSVIKQSMLKLWVGIALCYKMTKKWMTKSYKRIRRVMRKHKVEPTPPVVIYGDRVFVGQTRAVKKKRLFGLFRW